MTEHTTLPTDAFDKTLARLIGLPDGAHTSPSVVQAVDFYGNVTSFMVQTVKWDEGHTVFVTQVNADGSARYVLPPKVMAVVQRQQDAVTRMVRSRHGKRLAEQRRANGEVFGGFTPEMRKKALATRRAKAAKKRGRGTR